MFLKFKLLCSQLARRGDRTTHSISHATRCDDPVRMMRFHPWWKIHQWRYASVRSYLADSEISEINAANAASGYDVSTCASHDYCDSNMAMLEAISNVTGIPGDDIDVSDARFCELLNEAWAIAKRADFDLQRLATS